MYRPFTDEAVFFVKSDRTGVLACDCRDERGYAVFLCLFLDFRRQDTSDMLMQVSVTHVYRKVGGAAVGAPRTEGVEVRISHDLSRIVPRHDIGIYAAYPFHPCGEFVVAHLFLFKRKAGVADVMIIQVTACADV